MPRPNARIAIVDDDPAVRSEIGAIFGAGYEVVEGATLADAYRLLEDGGLDVLLLDVSLPVSGRSDPLKLVEDLAKTDIDTLVFALCEEMARRNVMPLIEAGAYEFFVKPIDGAVLRLLGVDDNRIKYPCRKHHLGASEKSTS